MALTAKDAGHAGNNPGALNKGRQEKDNAQRLTAVHKTSEVIAEMFFTSCAALAILAVATICFYIILKGIPAVRQVGIKEIFLRTEWRPTAEEPKFGILYIILTSLAGTAASAVIGVPAGILTAVYLAELADQRRAELVRDAVEILAGIPSVIYGLLGICLLNPLMYRLERRVFADSGTHQFTGGANLLSAVLVLTVMMLPTVIRISEVSIRAVHPGIKTALDHEAVDDPVEDQTVVVALVYQVDKVVDRVGRSLGIKLRLDEIAVFHFNRDNWILCHSNSPFTVIYFRSLLIFCIHTDSLYNEMDINGRPDFQFSKRFRIFVRMAYRTCGISCSCTCSRLPL